MIAKSLLPQALLLSGEALGRADMRDAGLEALTWLAKLQGSAHTHFAPVGCRGFYQRGGVPARFDQQPLEAHAMVLAALGDQAYFDQQVAPHLDGDHVAYIGSVGPAARDALLGGACALLHLISLDEPFGLSMVEAMTCGTPVLTYRRGSVPEVVRHGQSGWVVDTFDEAVAALGQLAAIDRAGV